MQTANRPRLILASASPARRKLLIAAGLDPEIVVSGVDESGIDAADAGVLCLELARLKASAVADRLGGSDPTGAETLVLGCDSVLGFDGEILGKPADAGEATERWQRMRGRNGVLYTGHCLLRVGGGRREASAVASTVVHFAQVSDEEIAAYVRSGEPLQVAGSFTIDGLGGSFVERIEGDHGTVIGLSLPVLRGLLNELALSIVDLWAETER